MLAGHRCNTEGCTKSAADPTGKCIAHGGGKRCERDGCGKAAKAGATFCGHHAVGVPNGASDGAAETGAGVPALPVHELGVGLTLPAALPAARASGRAKNSAIV